MHIGKSTKVIKHDPYGPSTHPMLVKCPAYTSDSVETVHTIKGTEKHKYVEMFLDPTHECYTSDTDYLEELMGESNEMRDSDKQMDQQDIRDVQIAIDQTRFFTPGSGMLDYGFLYVPTACESQNDCPLHVYFHGVASMNWKTLKTSNR